MKVVKEDIKYVKPAESVKKSAENRRFLHFGKPFEKSETRKPHKGKF